MADLAKIPEPATMARLSLTVTRGVTAGWIAGIPQVLVAQTAAHLLGIRERADIGPRFIRRAAEQAGQPLSTPLHWLVGGVFHFEYAALWGAMYALPDERLGTRRVPPLLGGALLGVLIHTAAFSRAGAATRTGAERAKEQRPVRESLVQWSAALSFGLTTAFTYRWLCERW